MKRPNEDINDNDLMELVNNVERAMQDLVAKNQYLADLDKKVQIEESQSDVLEQQLLNQKSNQDRLLNEERTLFKQAGQLSKQTNKYNQHNILGEIQLI